MRVASTTLAKQRLGSVGTGFCCRIHLPLVTGRSDAAQYQEVHASRGMLAGIGHCGLPQFVDVHPSDPFQAQVPPLRPGFALCGRIECSMSR